MNVRESKEKDRKNQNGIDEQLNLGHIRTNLNFSKQAKKLGYKEAQESV